MLDTEDGEALNCTQWQTARHTRRDIEQMLETLKITGAIALVIATATAVLSLLAWAYGF
jgi:hypothetical protein